MSNIGSLSSSDSTQDSRETGSSDELCLTSSHHSLLSSKMDIFCVEPNLLDKFIFSNYD